MNRKLVFWGYFLLLMGLLKLVPVYYRDMVMTSRMQYNLFFGYQEQPILLLMMGVNILFFDYLSVIIPKEELASIRPLFLTRKPPVRTGYHSCIRLILTYFIPFLLLKLYALTVLPQKTAIVIIIIWLFEWLLFFSLNFKFKHAIPNGVILAVFALTRLICLWVM